MGYRPITDVWLLARAKLKGGRKYYGAYLGGFPERARVLIGCGAHDIVLHACSGMAKHYPYAAGFGHRDETMDLDASTNPDYVHDVREPFPRRCYWRGIIVDPPYSEVDAAHYSPGADAYPSPNLIVANAIDCIDIGHRVGILHYVLPRCPKQAKFIACVGVVCGFNNRMRCFSVFERVG